jgi:hypothetical protein
VPQPEEGVDDSRFEDLVEHCRHDRRRVGRDRLALEQLADRRFTVNHGLAL